jgi:type VI secretion system secreted protein Hcp
MNVLVNNENIETWELRFWQPSATGQEVQFYTVELVNANIAGIRSEMLNNKYPENMQHKEREHVSFTYQKIIFTWEDGGITAEDDWESPVS